VVQGWGCRVAMMSTQGCFSRERRYSFQRAGSASWPKRMEVQRFMSRIKLSLLSILAVFAVGAVATASASAVEFELTKVECKGEVTTFCWEAETGTKEGLLELKGEQTFIATLDPGTETLLLGTLGAEESHINCTSIEVLEAVLRQPEPLIKPPTALFILHFFGCKLLPPESETCEVSAELTTKDIEGLFPTQEEVQFAPAEGTEFIGITYNSVAGKTCLNEGAQAVKGKQKCLWSKPEEDVKEHLLICLGSESELTLGTKNKAEFLLESLIKPEPLTGDLYDIVLG